MCLFEGVPVAAVHNRADDKPILAWKVLFQPDDSEWLESPLRCNVWEDNRLVGPVPESDPYGHRGIYAFASRDDAEAYVGNCSPGSRDVVVRLALAGVVVEHKGVSTVGEVFAGPYRHGFRAQRARVVDDNTEGVAA